MSYSQHIKDQMPRKYEFNILIAFLHISGLLIYLELKIKNSFLKIIKNLWLYNAIWIYFHKSYSTLWSCEYLSFCADQWESIPAVIHFKISFQTTFHALLLCIHISGIHCMCAENTQQQLTSLALLPCLSMCYVYPCCLRLVENKNWNLKSSLLFTYDD